MSLLLTGGNHVTLLESGVQFFPALIAAIDAAQRDIHLETYIFADDESGRVVAAALSRAAQRGVAVHVLVDGFGGADFADGLAEALRADGVNVLIYRPELAGVRFRRRRLRRLHRKLAVIDGLTAFVGGINIVDDWNDLDRRGQQPPRFDYAVKVQGSVVEMVHVSTHKLWQLVHWSRHGRRSLPRPIRHVPAAGAMDCAFVIRDNLRHRRDIEEAYLDAIANARQEIVLANAYFIPGRRFRQALIDAARRGVRVVLLLQGRVEYWLQHYATQFLYRQLLDAGIVIYEYRRSFLHAKVAVVDGLWTTVGSSNIDPFSLLLAREANLVTLDRDFASTLRESLFNAIESGGSEISQRHRRLYLWQRAANAIAYFLVRVAIDISRYGAKREFDE